MSEGNLREKLSHVRLSQNDVTALATELQRIESLHPTVFRNRDLVPAPGWAWVDLVIHVLQAAGMEVPHIDAT